MKLSLFFVTFLIIGAYGFRLGKKQDNQSNKDESNDDDDREGLSTISNNEINFLLPSFLLFYSFVVYLFRFKIQESARSVKMALEISSARFK